jgi:hypothetical protein
VPVEPPPPPAPIPLEFSGIQAAAPVPTAMNRIELASPEVKAVKDWVAASKDNGGLPFVVVDKVNAQVYAFTPYAQLKATAPILLGAGVGDVALVPQDAPMSAIPPAKRITPAGRYPSRLVNDGHKVVLLVDGPNLITMHIVAKGTPAQRRAERLASVTSSDNRVSFGCINVPPKFFTEIVDPDFRARRGIVYVLPEKTTAAQLFGFQPATSGPVGLQTALAGEGSPAPAAALQAAVQAGQPLNTLQATAAPAPLQTSLQGPASAAPLQTSLQTAVLPAPIEVPQAAPAPASAAPTEPAPVAQ